MKELKFARMYYGMDGRIATLSNSYFSPRKEFNETD